MDQVDVATPWLTPHVLGQDHAKTHFYQCVTAGRLGHGWLFTGPRGVGKMTFALLLARAVLNAGPPRNETQLAAGFQSESGHLVSRGVHPDLRVVALSEEEGAKHSIDVEQIRELKAFFTRSAGRSQWRVAIIDSIDDMTRQAVNALLKLLEEPPDYCLILIINHNAGRVIDTIRSRCQRLSFIAPNQELAVDILSNLLPQSDAQTRAAAVYLAQGSIGRAVDMVHHGGLALFETIMSLLSSRGNQSISELHRFCESVSRRDQSEQFTLFVTLLRDWIYRLARHQSDHSGFQPLFANEQELADALTQQVEPDALYACWHKLGEISQETQTFNLDKKQAALSCFKAIRDLMPMAKAI